MRAKTLNESSLNIYKNSDNTYTAIRNSKIYNFMWNPYKVYNFKKLGLNPTYSVNGSLIKNPHIQMILQVQNKINESLNENFVLKPKTEEEIKQALFKGEGFYMISVTFEHSVLFEFKPIKNEDDLFEFYNEIIERYKLYFKSIEILKIDTYKTSYMDVHHENIVKFYTGIDSGFDKIYKQIR